MIGARRAPDEDRRDEDIANRKERLQERDYRLLVSRDAGIRQIGIEKRYSDHFDENMGTAFPLPLRIDGKRS